MSFRQPAKIRTNLTQCIAPLLVFLSGFPCASAELQNVEVGGEIRIRTNTYSQHDVMIANCVWGLVDKDGKVIHEPLYAGVDEFSEGLAAVTMDPTWSHPRKWGFVDRSGTFVIEPQFDRTGRFSEGLAAVHTEAGWGYIDRFGNLAIPPQYEAASPFSSGVAVVQTDGIPGIIDRSGNVKDLPGYDSAWGICEGFVGVRKGERFGFVNLQGDLVIPLEFESVREFQNGVAPAMQQGVWGLLDTQGNFVVQPTYQKMNGYPGGIFCVTQSGRAGVIDSQGRTIIPIDYGESILGLVPQFTLIDGLLQLNTSPLATERLFFNLAGQLEFELSDGPGFYEQESDDLSWHVGFFQEGRARIQVHGKEGLSNGGFGAYGFIDTQGDVVIDPIYAGVKRFSEGVAWVAVPRSAH